MVITVDFDDTLMSRKDKRPGYRMGTPEKGVRSALTRLVQLGHTIIIFTAEPVQDERVRQHIIDWMNYFQIPFHDITNIKSVDFDIMIDNRALHYGGDWGQTMLELHRLFNPEYYKDYINEAAQDSVH